MAPVPLGKAIYGFMGDWWVIVTKIAIAPTPECFILKPDEVKAFAHRGEKEGRISYWLQPNKYHIEEFRRNNYHSASRPCRRLKRMLVFDEAMLCAASSHDACCA